MSNTEPTKKTRAYVAGAMTGLPNFNYDAFNIAAAFLRDHGFDVINPAENFGGDQSLPWETYLRKAIAQVAECDVIAMLPGWEGSRGARLEHSIAVQLRMPVLDATTGQPLRKERPHEEAVRLVHGDRNAAYGSPLSDYMKTAKMWSGMLIHKLLPGKEIEPQEAVLMMQAMKISRLMHKHKPDTATDNHGYALCYDWIAEELGLGE